MRCCPRFTTVTTPANAAGLKPVHDWVKVFERYWTDQIKQRAERKALKRMIRLDDGVN
jgi:hypothetical protein